MEFRTLFFATLFLIEMGGLLILLTEIIHLASEWVYIGMHEVFTVVSVQTMILLYGSVVMRAFCEEQVLMVKREGYREYTRNVHFRFILGVY